VATLTYAQLEIASDVVAAQPHGAGGRPGQVVAVLLPRGLTLVVALLEALKPGHPDSKS
jgi:non-ribosomal peptide synthetase component F